MLDVICNVGSIWEQFYKEPIYFKNVANIFYHDYIIP